MRRILGLLLAAPLLLGGCLFGPAGNGRVAVLADQDAPAVYQTANFGQTREVDLVLSDGRTFAEMVRPALEHGTWAAEFGTRMVFELGWADVDNPGWQEGFDAINGYVRDQFCIVWVTLPTSAGPYASSINDRMRWTAANVFGDDGRYGFWTAEWAALVLRDPSLVEADGLTPSPDGRAVQYDLVRRTLDACMADGGEEPVLGSHSVH